MDRSPSLCGVAARPAPAGYAAELSLARAVADEAGAYLLAVFGTVTARRKADGSLVTDADLVADRLIVQRLSAAFPSDAVLSEESSTRHGGQHRVWVVDPLDGTANYSHRVPLWGVSLALVADGRPVVAVSHFPCLQLSFWGALGQGAWEGARRLTAVTDDDLSANDLVTYCSRTPRRFALDLAGKGRTLGSETLNLALVATGATHASLAATSHVWDLAAGWLLIEEAGGAIALLDGGTVWPLAPGDHAQRTYTTVAAGNPALLAAVRAGVQPRAPRSRA